MSTNLPSLVTQDRGPTALLGPPHWNAFAGVLTTTLALLLFTGRSAAENLVVRNECSGPLLVQVVGVVGRTIRRERPVLLNAMDVSPAIAMAGNKILTIYDAKVPNRVLFQGAVAGSPMDQFIAVVPGFPPPRVRLEARQSFRSR
jgi:hypothetical protein